MTATVALLVVLPTGCASDKIVSPEPQLNKIVCWGDSMTAGGEGVADQGQYPALLQQQIGVAVVNMGVGGETSTQIGVREGGIPTFVTVAGGIIPAYGTGVTVVFTSGYEPLTSPNGHVHGSILGVEGQLTLSGLLPQGTFTFTPTSRGGKSVSAPGTPQYIPDQPYRSDLPIFWEGRNNLLQTDAGPWGGEQVLSDIAQQVAGLPQGTNYLVLSVLNENDPAERSNGIYYPNVFELNRTLSSMYGAHYLDIRSILVNSFDPSSAVDVTDHSYDVPPSSLSAISAQGTLSTAIGTSDTTFSVSVTSGSIRPFQTLIIDQESIEILQVNGSTITSATRGYGGTVSSHSAGVAVIERDPTHLNKQGDAIVANAIATTLGFSPNQAALRQTSSKLAARHD